MSRCPFCDYETPEPDDGDRTVQGWQEVAHMQLAHRDVIEERLHGDVFASVRFSEEVDERTTEPEPADEHHHEWAVDIPPLYGDEWINVASFDSREEAVAFVAERYGGQDGLVDLVTRL